MYRITHTHTHKVSTWSAQFVRGRDGVLLRRDGDINIYKVGICMFMRRFAKFRRVLTGPGAEPGTRQKRGHLAAWNLNKLRQPYFCLSCFVSTCVTKKEKIGLLDHKLSVRADRWSPSFPPRRPLTFRFSQPLHAIFLSGTIHEINVLPMRYELSL
jgi:hypothetical protein